MIIGDDDIEAKINVGREKAKEAAKAHNCLTIFPEFKLHRFDSRGKAFTDFNDLHVSHGLLEIQIQLEALMTKQKTIRAYLTFKDLDSLIKKFIVDSILDITKTEIFMEDHQFDIDIRAINCLNGELHFRDGIWR